MRPVTIVEELRPDIQDRVRSRFAREAEALRTLGSTRRQDRRVLKQSANGSIDGAWHAHEQRVGGVTSAIRPSATFADFVRIAKQEESAVLKG